MFDIRAIRDNPSAFEASLLERSSEFAGISSRILDLDEKLRAAKTAKQEAEQARNANSKLIGRAKASGDEAEFERLRGVVAEAKQTIEEAGETETTLQSELDDILMGLPNLPFEGTPVGEDESGNVQQGNGWGSPREFDFDVKDHADLGESLKAPNGLPMMDFERAVAMSGARFVALRGDLARLERALASFMLDVQTLENGYQEVNPPFLVRSNALVGTGQLPKFSEDLFPAGPDHFLIPTAEVPLTNLVRDQILEADLFPMRVTGHTPCFRSEAGSAGRDTKGMIRLHQFNKVELVSIVRNEEEGLAELERMTECAEMILEKLNLPYRRMLLCAGDMGAGARKTYDLEVWLPSQNMYREISSCSYCGEYQARRMNARYRPEATEEAPKPKPEFVHTLNGSGLAVGRTLVAVLENYQQADGSIAVPDVLQPYLGGQAVIGAAS